LKQGKATENTIESMQRERGAKKSTRQT